LGVNPCSNILIYSVASMTEWEVSVAKVLVVNDDPSMRQALARALANWGYESVEIDDDRGTLTVAVSENPEVILLDLIGQQTNTLAVLRELKEDAHTASTPVIILTNRYDPQYEELFRNEGAFDFLAGRWTLEQLRSRIRVALLQQFPDN
jgi:DNA-binding response OmpR family regulator